MSPTALRDQLLTAQMQARLCDALYGQPGAVADLGAAVGARWRIFEAGYVTGGVLLFDDHAHLAITGSNDRYDWLQNLSARQVLYRDGLRVHAGFADACGLALAELNRSHIWRDIGNRRVIMGGHSAGGAIAHLVSLFHLCERVVTFGAPRVFDPDSAAQYRAMPWRTDRYVRPGDPVTQLPLRTHYLLFGGTAYRHSAAPLHLTPDGLRTDESTGGLRAITRRVADVWAWGRAAGAKLWGPSRESIYRHSMAGYCSDLQEILTRQTTTEIRENL